VLKRESKELTALRKVL